MSQDQSDNLMQENSEEQNLQELFTSNDILDNIQIYDSTVEVIGYIDGLDSPRIVGSNQQYKIFKFYLNNGSGRRIQIVVWNDDIENILPYIIPNKIIHLDGVQARIPKISNFINGNVQYDLLIRSNTVISNLGDYEPNQILSTPIRIKINEILNVSGNIIVEGYIKSNFGEVHDNKLNKLIGYGSITDGTYKLEIHIVNFYIDEYCAMGISKGDKIEITGTMQTSNIYVYTFIIKIR
ncbi:uncharacterized protein LOC113562612, partial [Ooceraea biroi]|uniref:uncharacterized protein LOC113562612 n=1 Tax=Ooceraea biroi TaxID=2015173 RepID=UPI000F090491